MKKSGFTLIELIVTLGIIALLVAVAILKVGGDGAWGRDREVRQVIRDLNYCRFTAIAENRSIRFKVVSGTNTYEIVKDNITSKSTTLKYFSIIALETSDAITFTGTGVPINATTLKMKPYHGQTVVLTVQPINGKVNRGGL